MTLMTFHPSRALPAAIESIFTLEGDVDVVLVNNTILPGAQDVGILRTLPGAYPRIRLIELDRNYGCSGGFNRGIRALTNMGDILVYMSCDALMWTEGPSEDGRRLRGRKKVGLCIP